MMRILRSLLVWLIFIPFTLIWFFPVCASIVLPRRRRHKLGVIWYSFLLYLIKKIIGLDFTVAGTENIPSKSTIICCKHQSAYETLALQKFLPYQVFIIKKELLFFPLVGLGLYIMNSIFVDRKAHADASRKHLLELARTRRDAGFWITIFPEGTRVPPGQKGTYKYGAARLARELKMNILPIATNSGEYWPKGLIKYPGTAKFVVGPVISYEAGSPEEIMRRCEEWIEKEQRLIEGEGPLGPKKKRLSQGKIVSGRKKL